MLAEVPIGLKAQHFYGIHLKNKTLHHLIVLSKNDLVSTKANPLSTYLVTVIFHHGGSFFPVML